MLRLLGGVLMVAGIGLLGWSGLVWLWQDPFTALYTYLQQNRLTSHYEDQYRSFRPLTAPPGESVAVERRRVAREAWRYRRRLHEGDAIARIRVARLGLNMIVVNGTARDTLRKGPGRDLRTFMPGEGKLVYVAGHRTTYSAPFSRIEALRRGDRVTLELPYATFVYRIVGHIVVPADDLARLRSRGFEELALQACHPRFFATQRYIAYARPVRVEPRGGDPFTLPAGKNAEPVAAAS
jgi:sortase A